MSSGCKAAIACVDARAPVRASYVNLYKWPESDAEFVKSVTRGGGRSAVHSDGSDAGSVRWAGRPAVVDSYSCRQMYLRSYTFSKKESVPERTRRCLDKVKERAVLFHQRRDSGSSIGESSEKSRRKSTTTSKTKKRKKKKKKKKKGCVAAVKRVRDVSCAALYSIFHRLLSCTTSVDVADGQPPQ